MIRGGVIGVTAVAAPSVALGIAVVCIVRGLGPYLGMLAVTFVLVGVLAWACVHVGHFQPRLAVFLTTLPFGVLVLLTLSALLTGSAAGFLIALGELAFAVFIAWAATHLARR